MLPADIKLLNELHATDEIKTIEQLQERFLEKQKVLEEKLNSSPIPEHLQGLDKDIAVLRILSPSDIYAVLSIGIYQAYETKDMSILNNALYSYNRLNYYRHTMLSGGYDHCIYLMNAIESFAGNDIALIKKMFNKNSGMASNGHRFLVTATNLIMAMLWKDEIWKEKSLKDAEKFLTRKNGNSDNACVNYFISIINQDIQKASEYLAELCQLYKKNGFVHNFKNPFLKVFGAYIHGLYNMAYQFLPADKFEQLARPGHTVFWKEFADYNLATQFIPGKPFIVFENELTGLNKIYE